MAVSTMIKAIKEVHPQNLVLVKIGNFYHAYGRDAVIMSYLFGYRTKVFERNNTTCGFPISSISKVLSKLEDKKINYVLLDKRDNYHEDEKFDNKNLNQYSKIYEKARKYVNMRNRVDVICNTLIKECNNEEFKEKIIRIEEVLYEGRKV